MKNYLKLAVLNISVVIFFGSIITLIMGYIKNNIFNYFLLIIILAMFLIIKHITRDLWVLYLTLKK